ncbi:MAG TPA: tetratricopeptide repeat protein [Longimicrobium sp.]
MPVQRSAFVVEELLGLLPALDELEVLRLRLIGAAAPDPRRMWDSSTAYTTVDKRVLSPTDVEQSLAEADEALRQYVATLHDRLRPLFRSFFEGDLDTVARHLVGLGEHHEALGRARSARKCYDAAMRVALPLVEKGAQVLALRRIGRVALSLGDFQEAALHYERSAELARDSGDLHGEVVARTGEGNVLLWQGNWREAENYYRDALARAESAPAETLTTARGHLYNNLGNVATRLRRLDEAEEWFKRALAVWSDHPSPGDLGVCLHNLGHLRLEQGRMAEAAATYERAIKLEVPPTLRVAIAVDLAQLLLREGHLTQAEDWALVAENHAIAAASPYLLGRMYQGRGNIARARGHADGFTLYEKALEIARGKGYPFLEAETLADYAELRLQTGGVEEAQAYLERARDIFKESGAVQDCARAEASLARLASSQTSLAATRD